MKDKKEEIMKNIYNEDEGEDQTPEKKEDQHSSQDNITSLGIPNNPFNFNTDIQYITVIGHIEGHNILPARNKTTKYEHIIPQLIASQENDQIKGVLIILNTVGGDVEAGLAISELIATISKPTVSIVLGGGHSIGVPLATASDYSFIAETATMTIHPIRTNGLVIGAEQTYNYFKKMQDRIIKFICRTTKVKREKIIELMNATDEIANDIGTILIGKEAVDIGLINEVGGITHSIKKLKEMIEENEKKDKTKS